jgi:peptidoglycan/xylan/chitin deacetylase (PgdA/CDA1 family)
VPVQLPEGKRLAVCLSPDFDAQSVWLGTFRSRSQTNFSRGEFGAVVGAPRLLAVFRRFGITTTWCVPTHTMRTFPEALAAVVEDGHEIAAHGVYHEYIPALEREEERRLLELQVSLHESILGRRPRGYRSPALDITDHTLDLLAEFGFEWDSSLMGRDFEPYRPRQVTVHREEPNEFGPPSPVLELPVSWFMDDFPALDHVPGVLAGLMSTDDTFARWRDNFDYAYENHPGGILTHTVHGLVSGRAHAIMMLERFIAAMKQHDDVWFATLSDIHDCWSDD